MRVGVDARTVFAPRRRGTGKNLIDLYRALAVMKPNWHFTMLHQGQGNDDPFAHLTNVTAVAIDIPGDRFNAWQDVRLPAAALSRGLDVLHCPANTAPWFTATPTVLTIHDLIPLEIAPDAPETSRWLRRVQRNARRARRILTPSHYSERAIIDRLGVTGDKITINYWAPDHGCRPPTADAVRDLRARFALGDAPYVMAFGADDPRKNTARIIEAWGALTPGQRADAVLVIVGLQPEALARMQALLPTYVSDGSCRLHGFAAEADISTLTGGAIALCYPSLSEGFGLPVVDAFACGTPVITSSTTSLGEIAGDAALVVEPTDVGAIRDALATLIASPARRDELRAAGQRRLGLFSWTRCAETAAHVLSTAVGRDAGGRS